MELRRLVVRRAAIVLGLAFLLGSTAVHAETSAELVSKASKLQSDGKVEDALAAYQAATAAAPTGKEKLRSLAGMAACLRQLGRLSEARKCSMQALDLCPPNGGDPNDLTGCIRDVVDGSAKDEDMRESIALLEKVAQRGLFPPNQVQQQAAAIRWQIGQLYTRLGETDKACEIVRRVIADPDASNTIRGDGSLMLARALLKQEKYAEGLEAAIAALPFAASIDNSTLVALQTAVIKAMLDHTDSEQACSLIARLRPRAVPSRETCDLMQNSLIDLLASKGRYAEACHEAKILTETCTTGNMPAAVAKAAAMLKAADGDLVRANAFLEYQKFLRAGPDGKLGTKDDMENPLAKLAPTPDPARDQLFQKALDECPKTWEGALWRSRICRYWEKPADALRELKKSFALAPMDAKPLQLVTDETVEVLLQLAGATDVGRRFVDFQKHGAAGPDRQAGTPDDLKSPVEECLAALAATPAKAPSPPD